MPRIQVQLPVAVYETIRKKRLPASKLLQEAIRAELRRRRLANSGDEYISDLVAEVGRGTGRQRARAATIAGRVAGRSRK